MPLKTILVCLNTPEHADAVLKLAVPLARRNNAHLIGLHVLEALVVYPGIAMHVPGEFYVHFNESQKTRSEELKTIFERHTKAESFQSEFRLLKAEAITAADRIVESARAVDLVIMAQQDRKWDQADLGDAQDQVIRRAGRPLIVVPQGYEGPTPGSSVILGWSDTREATRAAHDLLSIAEPNAKVTILRIGAQVGDELVDTVPVALAESYHRHGLDATLRHVQPDGKTVAKTLCHEAFELGADLIVTGAFGHSKAYDFVIGAATYELLKEADLPVMFSK